MAYVYVAQATWQLQSWEVLMRRAEGTVFSHTLEYDMESILYSVLHCALFNLEVTGGDPEACIQNMFDAVIQSPKGLSWGGDGKSANAMARRYTSDLTWACPDVKVWLDRVMELHRPVTTPLLQRMDPANQWTAVSLNAFWSSFLTQRPGLPLSDRKNSHLLTEAEQPERFLSRLMRNVPNPAPVGYGVRGVVHKRAGASLDHEAPARRRQRTTYAQAAVDPELGVLSPSTEPPPPSIADSDHSDDEQQHDAMPPAEAALYQLLPHAPPSLPTGQPYPGPPFPSASDLSITAYPATMYGHPSSAGTSSAHANSARGYARHSAPEPPLYGDSHSSNSNNAHFAHLGRDEAASPAVPSHAIVIAGGARPGCSRING